MKKVNKYKYTKVIQQYYSAGHGWEDASEYPCNSAGSTAAISVENYELFKNDLKEYRLLGYPTRTIVRKAPNLAPVL